MPQTPIEHDPLFELLTDALRAGPESPQWRDAVERVREADSTVGDEFVLLSRARERLAQGREYRSLRAGPTFTRRVMDRIEEEASQVKKGLPWANVIAVVSMLVMLAAVAAIVYLLMHSADRSTMSRPWVAWDERISMEYLSGPPDFAQRIELSVKSDVGQERLLLRWQGNSIRLLREPSGQILADLRRSPQRLRMDIDGEHVQIEADGAILWTGKHDLPTRGMRQADTNAYPW